MLDIPETVIIILSALLVFLWTRHWLLFHRSGRRAEPGKPKKQNYWD